ncbi:7390_t:CDS:2, partial [Scutellospora calospora]
MFTEISENTISSENNIFNSETEQEEISINSNRLSDYIAQNISLHERIKKLKETIKYIKDIEKDTCKKCKELQFLKDYDIFKEVCSFKNCKKLKIYKELKDINNKLTKNFDNYCEHRLCQWCALKFSIRFN